MNRILLILVFIFSFVFSFGQPIVPRSNGSLTVGDTNSFIGNSFRPPLFFDTLSANRNRPSLDSMGKIIFTRDVNWFWGRVYIPGTSSHKWVPFANPSTNLNVNCGNSIGGHIVTRDSALTFDVTGGPYVLCCDGIPRATNFTTVTLAQGDSLNPRWDAIILDSNGVHVIQGIPDPNPTFPQINSCQILLTYVNVLTGQMAPAGITQTVIYDEFVQGEWDSLRRSLITVDSLNPNFPIHGAVAAYVNNYSGVNYFEFHTDTAVDLNNYSALKFYIRDSSAVRVSISWYLDNQPQTPPVLAPVQTFNLNNYQVIVMPISNWRFTQNSTLANTIRFSISAVNPLDAKGLYIDWVQLQGGILITNTSTTGVQSFSATGIDAVGTTVNNPNGPNTQLVLTKPNQPPWTVYGNPFGFSAPFIPTAVDLSTPMITGLLDPIHILPSTTDGDILVTENNGGGLIATWDHGGEDTTFVLRWIRRFQDPNSFNDSLGFGSPFRDSAVINESIFTGLNHFTWTMTDTTNDLFQFNSSGIKSFDGVLPTSGSGGTDSAIFRNSSTGQWYLAPSGGAGTETLQQVFNTEVGGSLLTKSDSIQADTNILKVFGSAFRTMEIWNTADAFGLYANAGNGVSIIGVTGTGTGINGFSNSNGIGVLGQSSSGSGIAGESTTGFAGIFTVTPSSTNTVVPILSLARGTSSVGANGIGGSIDFGIATSIGGGGILSNQIISKWTDATLATRTSEFDIVGVSGGFSKTLLQIMSEGQLWFTGGSSAVNIFINDQGSGASAGKFVVDADNSGNYETGLYVNSDNGTFLNNIASISAYSDPHTTQVNVNPSYVEVHHNDSGIHNYMRFRGNFTPANSTDNTYPTFTLTTDDTNLYYRTSGGTWVKIPWQVF